MVAYQGGDTEAFRELYDRHAHALINFFYKMTYDRAMSEVLTQEAFIRLIRFRDRYRPEATFRTFMYRVAKNLWIDQYRSKKNAPRVISADRRLAEGGATVGDLLESADTSQSERAEHKEAAALIHEALEQLPEGQRMVFLLAESEGLKYREISEILDIPVGTIKSRMNAAVHRLRGLLGHVIG